MPPVVRRRRRRPSAWRGGSASGGSFAAPPGAVHPRLRWRAVGALAATVALAVGGAWMWRAAQVTRPESGGDVSAQVEDLAGTLFATSEVTAAGEQSDEAAGFDEDDELAL